MHLLAGLSINVLLIECDSNSLQTIIPIAGEIDIVDVLIGCVGHAPT